MDKIKAQLEASIRFESLKKRKAELLKTVEEIDDRMNHLTKIMEKYENQEVDEPMFI